MPSPDPIHKPDARPTDGPSSAAGSGTGSGLLSPGGRGSGSGSGPDEPTRVTGSGHVTLAGGDMQLVQSLIAGYELVEEIHRGGQGVVYRALQLGTKRQVALKVLLEGPFAGDAARRRFEREVELAASLHHPSIVTILDSGISHGRYFFAMELIEGARLDQYLKRERPPLRDVVRLLAEICEAINFAHQRGVIHRDLKPSNILVDAEGRPHVLDFGLAKGRTSDPQQTTLAVVSTSGQMLGTIAYMSPEQAAGGTDVDVRSDVYSLGVVFYEALLGVMPYPVGGTLAEVLTHIAHTDPIRPRAVRHASRFGRMIDDELETILLRALEKEPARRYQSAGDLARDMRHYLDGEPIEAKRASGMYMFRKLVRRYRAQAALAAGLLLALMGFLAVMAVLYSRERDARAHVERLRVEAAAQADAARAAESAERSARTEAEAASQRLRVAAEDLRRALVGQKVQRGNLALAQNDLAEARDSFWDAYDDQPDDAAALWALRQYYQRSGDTAAQELHFNKQGPVALSPGGRIAAACETPQAITVRDVTSGRILAWLPMPQKAQALSVSDSGVVAAAGSYWLRLWRGGSAMPTGVVELSEMVEPLAVFALPDGESPAAAAASQPADAMPAARLLLLEAGGVRCFDGVSGRVLGSARFGSAVSGLPSFSAARRQLAVPTRDGVALVHVGGDGALRSAIVWPAEGKIAPRAVDLTEDGQLAVLSDGVDVARLRGGDAAPSWTRVVWTPERWDFVSLAGDDLVLLGARDGRVASFRSGAAVDAWRVTRRALEALCWSAADRAAITLDDRGCLTHWNRSAALEQHRQVHDKPATTWEVSTDGSTLMLADADGLVVTYTAGQTAPRIARRPYAGARLVPGMIAAADMSLALSGNGGLRVVRYDNRVWIERGSTALLRPATWDDAVFTRLRDVAVSDDGAVLALRAESANGERQLIKRLDARPRQDAVRRGQPTLPPPAAPGVTLVGSTIREMLFIPGTRDLLVARSNGALLVIPFAEAVGAARDQTVAPPAPWAVLDSPPTALAIDRGGQTLAAGCEDGVVRLLSVLDSSEFDRISVGQPVSAVGFDSGGNVLMVRTADGGLGLYDLKTMQRISHWALAGASPMPLAAWVGRDDTLLLDYGGKVYEHEHRTADQAISRNLGFGRQRAAAGALRGNNLSAAWESAAALVQSNPAAGVAARLAIAELALRQGGRAAPQAWIDELTADSDATTLLRLAHAAYDGGQFDEARAWLRRASELCDARLDAYSAWRLAECDYLVGPPSKAADALAEVGERRDFDDRDATRLRLERVAALILGDRGEEASDVVMSGRTPNSADRGAALDGLSLVVITNYMLGKWGESQLAATFDRLVALSPEGALQSRDDIEFFAAEVARKRGDLAGARERYQRCIDLARDTWPSNWARYRLGQLARGQ